MAKTFIGRVGELEMLNRMWKSSKAELIILYGRRRVGKTRLLTHWIQEHEGEGLYWMAEPSSAVDQLRSFSQALANFADPEDTAPLDFTYANWEQAFRQVALLAQGRRMALFIDEITYLMDTNRSIIGTLQKVWDHRLSQTNLVLALSGSQMGMMQEDMLSYDAPLYGRATVQLELPSLPFGASGRYFPNYAAEERVKLYAIWGGVPAYWERIQPNLSVMENLYEQLRPSNAWMLDEPRLLLQDFLTEFYNYVGIMRAMAQGVHALGEIGKRNGLSSTHMSSYLRVLRDTHFVERRVPVTQRNSASRLGRYHVTDPYLRFYYRFLAAYQSKLAMGQQEQVLRSVEETLGLFIETNTWREMCQEWLLRASAADEIPVPIEAVGGEWKRTFHVDVVGISEEDRGVALGCSLWQDAPGSLEAIRELASLTGSVVGKNEPWSIYYIGFSKSGWTEDAHAQAEALLEEELQKLHGQWQFAGVRLLDIGQVDADLANWSDGPTFISRI
ncbi:MAG: ATP-binding protein [Chloroflexi bacterium]|nr:ATP-binding protein [Chloroflexota bacterium]